MDNFLMREISEKDEEYLITVTRIRNTNGYGKITIQYGTQKIEFTGDGYERCARRAGELLDKIADTPCLLPEVSND